MKNSYSYPWQNRSLSDLPKEQWKEIPGFDGNYLISNYGRVSRCQGWLKDHRKIIGQKKKFWRPMCMFRNSVMRIQLNF